MPRHRRVRRGRRRPSLFRRGRRWALAPAQLPLEVLRLLRPPGPRRRRKPPLGSQPGEMALPEESAPLSLRVMAYSASDVLERECAPEELPTLLGDPERTLWIDVAGFGDRAVLVGLGETLGIHPLALADIVNVPQRPKAELYGDRLLVVLRMTRLVEGGAIESEQVSLVVGPGWVASFQERRGDVFDPVRARIRSAAARIRQMREDYLAYALLDAVIDGYLPVVDHLGASIDALEEEVITRPTHATLARIHATRRTLVILHGIQRRQRDAIGSMLRDAEFPFSDAVRIFLRDARDHAFEGVDALENHRDTAVGLMELYLSSASNRLNEVMKTLTVVATIFIPLTFLAGVYGMNFEHMPELGWRWGYPAVWAVMLGTAGGLLAWFRARGWLGSREADAAPGG